MIEAGLVPVFYNGAACVGMGSKLISKELVAAGDYPAITAKVRQALIWIEEIRNGESPV